MKKILLLWACLGLFLVGCASKTNEQAAREQFEKLQAALFDRGIDIYLDGVYELPGSDDLAVDIYIDEDDAKFETDILKEVHSIMPEYGFTPRDSQNLKHLRYTKPK